MKINYCIKLLDSLNFEHISTGLWTQSISEAIPT